MDRLDNPWRGGTFANSPHMQICRSSIWDTYLFRSKLQQLSRENSDGTNLQAYLGASAAHMVLLLLATSRSAMIGAADWMHLPALHHECLQKSATMQTVRTPCLSRHLLISGHLQLKTMQN